MTCAGLLYPPTKKPGHRDHDHQREHVMQADVGCAFDFLRRV
jgi:hypothetical protein